MEGTTEVDLPEVDVGVEAMGVARLVVKGDVSSPALLEDAPDLVEVAVDPVDFTALDPEPGAAVDPGSPFAETRGGVRGVAVVNSDARRRRSSTRGGLAGS